MHIKLIFASGYTLRQAVFKWSLTMENSSHSSLPLVYACSGCTGTAQLANDVAVSLSQQGAAEMSCITGVGGNVDSLVQLAKSNRLIIALEGCSLSCVKQTLARHGVSPTWHIQLDELCTEQSWSLTETYQTLTKIYRIIGQDFSGDVTDPLRKLNS